MKYKLFGLALLVAGFSWFIFGKGLTSNSKEIPEEAIKQAPESTEQKQPENFITTGRLQKPAVPPDSAPRRDLPVQEPLETQRSNLGRNEAHSLAEPGPVDSSSLIRDTLGNLVKMDQANAMKACAARKMHLPTMRELAEIGQSRGAKGILETKQVKVEASAEDLPRRFSPDGTEEDTYYLEDVRNPGGGREVFYYNPRGYVAPAGDLGEQWFFSSSVDVSKMCVLGLNSKNGVLACNGHETQDGHVYDAHADSNSAAFCAARRETVPQPNAPR